MNMMGDVATNSSKQDPSAVRGFALRVGSILDRVRLGRLFGQAFGGKRDYYETFGWDRTISPRHVWEMYYRGGIAKRVADAYPEAVWSRPPKLYIADDASWTDSFDGFTKAYDLWDVFRRLHIMTNLGRYGVLVIGTDKGELSTPQKKGAKITYLQPYAEKDIKVHSYDTDPRSERFGRPLMYQVYPASQLQTQAGVNSVAPKKTAFYVHWTRTLHVVRDPLEHEDFGSTVYTPIWNYLTDLVKVVGSSAESYWLTAFPGLHADVDKEMELEPGDEENLSAEVDEYMHSFRRTIRTRGVKVQTLNGGVANPAGAFDVILTLIAGTTGIPKRVLLGSEAGQLASTQDKGNWAERIEEMRENFCEPRILMKFMRWLVDWDIMPCDLNKLQKLWPDAYRMSPLERSQQGAQIARSLANIQKGLQPIELEPAVDEIPATPPTTTPDGTTIPGQPGKPGKAAVLAEPLLTRDEARRIIGLSTDQNVLSQTPE